MPTWAMEKFSGAAFGEARLNRRLIKLSARRLVDKQTAGIPSACGDRAEMQVPCRSFGQASDDKHGSGWQAIFALHIVQTEARMQQHPAILRRTFLKVVRRDGVSHKTLGI